MKAVAWGGEKRASMRMLIVVATLAAAMATPLARPATGQELPELAPAVAGAWTATTSLGATRSISTATVLDGPDCEGPSPRAWCGKVLVAGGTRGPSNVLSSAEIYDPVTGTWAETGAMSSPRKGHTATLIDGPRCRMPSSRPAACGKVLVAGGGAGPDGLTGLDSAELYDPNTGTWTPTGSMAGAGGPRFFHSEALLDGPRCRDPLPAPVGLPAWCGKVLVVAGLSAVTLTGVPVLPNQVATDPPLSTAALYDPSTGTWAATGSMALPRWAHTLTALDGGPCRGGQLPVAPPYCGRLLITGGSPTIGPVRQGYTEAELYDPDLGQWVPTGPTTASRFSHSAALLDGPACRTPLPAPYCNKVLVAGGFTTQNAVNPAPLITAELYDPLSGTWAPTGPMNTGRALDHTMTLLDGPACRSEVPAAHCGKVLVAQSPQPGTTLSGGAPDLYDPAEGRFFVTRHKVTEGEGSAVLIDGSSCRSPSPPASCGRVLLYGGGGDELVPVTRGGAFAELFDGAATLQPPTVVDIEPASAPAHGGLDVRLTGAGFDRVTDVRFGDVPAAYFRAESPTVLVVTSPSHPPGPVDVTVASDVGTSASTDLSAFAFLDDTHGWLTTGSRLQEVLEPTLTPLEDGRLLAVGGQATPTAAGSNSAEIFDPSRSRWDPVEPLATARRSHTATRLISGEVLVVGGTGPECCPALASAEIFDPATGRWRATGSLNEARALHAATLLPSGKVLVTGGQRGSFLASSELYDPSSGTWTSVAPMSKARRRPHTALLADGRVIVVGGFVDCCTTLKSAEIYDPQSDRWTPTGSLNNFRRYGTLTELPDDRLLLAGGCENTDDCGDLIQPMPDEIYDPIAGSWRQILGMHYQRHDHTATVVSGTTCDAYCGKVLVAGGHTADGVTGTAELFDPADDTWTPAPALVVERERHQAAALPDGRVVVLGGRGPGSGVLKSAEIFGPVERVAEPPHVGAVEPPAGAPGTRVRITGSGLSGTTGVRFGDIEVEPEAVTALVVVAISPPQRRGTVTVTVTTPLGTSLNDPLSVIDDFTYPAGRWRGSPPMKTPRYLHTSTLLDGPPCRGPSPPGYCGSVFVAGGTENFLITTGGGGPPPEPHRSAELYDPDTSPDGAQGAWSATSDMVLPRFNHTATLLDGPECRGSEPAPAHCGKVLVVGGQISTAFVAETAEGVGIPGAEVYDPVSRRWTSTAPMNHGRFSHTATLLNDGRVLVAGGSDRESTRNGLASAEIYDPRTGAWTETPPLATPRNSHTGTLLKDGRVMIAGGLHDGEALPGVEMFDPATGTWAEATPMPVSRFAHTATLLDGPGCGDLCGQVLVAGGVQTSSGSGTVFHSSTEIYDPARDRWSPAASLGGSRAGHTATLLPNGTVLVVGGAMTFPAENIPAPISTSEIFYPHKRAWVFTDHSVPRGLHGAALLDGPACRRPAPPAFCGAVVVSGGATVGTSPVSAFAPPPLASTQIYFPAPDVNSVTPSVGSLAGGQEVVLEGTAFAGASGVSFGGTPAASVHVDSPLRMTAVTPPFASVGPAEVVVEGPGGTSARIDSGGLPAFVYVGLPGAVADLTAGAVSDTEIILNFSAAHNGDGSSPAQDYEVRSAAEPLNASNFDTEGTTLCSGRCHFDEPARSYSLRVGGLTPGTTYHFALRAINEYGRGPLSAGVAASTTGIPPPLPPLCPSGVSTGPGSVAYPAGRYSLVGLPGSVLVPSDSPLYGWFNIGAGGTYSVRDPRQPVEAGRGYWAWFACTRPVDLSPALATPNPDTTVAFPLDAYHAAMVGNPSVSPSSVTGHDFAARWHPALNGGAGGYVMSSYRATQALAVGEGAWVFSYVRTEVRIEPRG